jgi:hypothetical protein
MSAELRRPLRVLDSGSSSAPVRARFERGDKFIPRVRPDDARCWGCCCCCVLLLLRLPALGGRAARTGPALGGALRCALEASALSELAAPAPAPCAALAPGESSSGESSSGSAAS